MKQYLTWGIPINEKWKSLSGVWLFVTPWIVRGILQARILKWVAIPFSRESSQPSDWTQVSLIAGKAFARWATREASTYQQKANLSQSRESTQNHISRL